MLRHLKNRIVSAGLADMVSASQIITQDSEKYVEHLLKLVKKFSTLVKSAFSDDPRFLTARDKAFTTSVFKLASRLYWEVKYTVPESKYPELLANYCGMLLRRTPLSKRWTSEQIDGRARDFGFGIR
uniref:Cullin-5 n=1 Tax=Glossina morsitans morsitans TaxID=37546 RepID=A0A1B0GC07_GLOMM